METFVAIIILCEVLITLACVFGMIHEDKIVRIEHAFVKAITWHLLEKMQHREIRFDEVKGGVVCGRN